MRQFIPVGYITLVDHLIFYSKARVYSGIKYTCTSHCPEIADMLLRDPVRAPTLAVLVPHNCLVPPMAGKYYLYVTSNFPTL